MKLYEKDIKELTNWINNNCDPVGINGPTDIKPKIDLLVRVIGLLRIHNKYLDNNLNFEKYIQGRMVIEELKLCYKTRKNRIPRGKRLLY